MAALVNHPGMWLAPEAAAAINALEKEFGPIRINRAGVTKTEQQAAIDRWDRGGPANRPPFLYEPKRPAEESDHVPGLAVDVYNYTGDRGKLEKYGFKWYGPKDPVHYTFVGRSGGGSTSPETKDEDMDFFNLQGKGGSHRAGLFAAYRGNDDGKLYARRLTVDALGVGVPTVPNEALPALKNTVLFIDL